MKLLDKLREQIRLRHYSIRTEQAYCDWVRRYVFFHEKRHPSEMGATEVRQFLSNLAVARDVSASTQNQALQALLFLYKYVVNKDLGHIPGIVRASTRDRIPVVLTKAEKDSIMEALPYPYKLMCRIMYGSGLRLTECLSLRVKDIDFERLTITVRGGKGDKDRMTVLSKSIVDPLKEHLARVKLVHQKDLADGYGSAYLPPALERAMPNQAREWIWQYVFPSASISIDPRSGAKRRHHLHLDAVNKHIRNAARLANIDKRVSAHAFRHSFATHLIESGTSIHTVQDLLGHSSIETTKIYLHVMRKPGSGLQSPEDIAAN
jgi:integron integrase